MADIKNKRERRLIRHARVRKSVSGSAQMPRLVVFKSARHLYAQVIDDATSHVITGASTLSPEIAKASDGRSRVQLAEDLGKLVAKRCRDKSVEAVVFDRNGYRYHGIVKAIAETVRAENLLA